MKDLVIFCYALLSVIGMGEAAMCRSTVDCPGNDSWCTVNCSAVAVNVFDQPASHGNCRISITFEGDLVHGCYIHECNTSHPDLCVPEFALDDDAASCCCTEDDCNDNFTIRPENPTNATALPPGLGNRTHLYPTYPTHVGSDKLVCLYHGCEDNMCETQYEVCLESPVFNNFTIHFICYTLFVVNVNTSNYTITQRCFHDPHSNCSEECVLNLHGPISHNTALVDCCCTENLCNNVTFDPSVFIVLPSTTISPSPMTSTVIPSIMIGSSPTASIDMPMPNNSTGSSSNTSTPMLNCSDSNSDNSAIIGGAVGGVILLLIITIVLCTVILCVRRSCRKKEFHDDKILL